MNLSGEQILAIISLILAFIPVLFPEIATYKLSIATRAVLSTEFVGLSLLILKWDSYSSFVLGLSAVQIRLIYTVLISIALVTVTWRRLCRWCAWRLTDEDLRYIYSVRLAASMRNKREAK